MDDFEDEDDYDIGDLLTDLETGDSDMDFDDMGISDFEDEDDYTLEDLMKDLESNEYEILGDEDSSNLIESNKYDIEDFEDDFEKDIDVLDEESSIFVEEESNLKSQNESIKLDLWLRECVDQRYMDSFLKYNSIKIEGGKSPLSEIISRFELEEFIKFKYRSNLKEFKKSLKELFFPLGIMQIVDIASKHDVSISLTKDGLINNFLNKYTIYEIIVIFNEEGLNINDYLNISVLEQIYLLSDSNLEKISKGLLPYDKNSKYEMISSIVNQYSDDYLISDEIFKGDDL